MFLIDEVSATVQWSIPPSCGCRTMSGIIFSCFATIFACIWVAIHPNVPTKRVGHVMLFTRMILMVAALVAPEIIIFWAMKQNISSHKFANKFTEAHPQLTVAHGFLVCMEGITVDDSGDTATSDPENEVEIHGYEVKIRDICDGIKKNAIADKSKADALSKIFAALQTGWFVIQCIARGAKRLPITELELATIGYAILNIAACFIWYEKPLSIGVPFKLPGKRVHGGNSKPMARTLFGCACRDVMEALFEPFQSNRTGYALIGTSDDRNMDWPASAVAGALAMIVGVVHCFAWNSVFQSPEAKWSWRICSLVATGFPVLVLTLMLYSRRKSKGSSTRQLNMVFCIIISALARTVLLAQALLAMRHIPAAAYDTVSWTSLIPHI